MIAALLRIAEPSCGGRKMAVLNKLADNMLTTYLGGDAGKRVLNGQIRRGDGETIRAALVMADMRGSTMLAETAGREGYIETLNQFFDAIAAPFNRSGGQILSFLGDGFLAVYPCERHRAPSEVACQAALARRVQGHRRGWPSSTRQRAQAGLGEIGYGIGLHVGNVMFGNVGLTDRLTFSAFGVGGQRGAAAAAADQEVPAAGHRQPGLRHLCGGGWMTLGNEKLRRRRGEGDGAVARHGRSGAGRGGSVSRPPMTG